MAAPDLHALGKHAGTQTVEYQFLSPASHILGVHQRGRLGQRTAVQCSPSVATVENWCNGSATVCSPVPLLTRRCWEMVLVETRIHDGELVAPVESLELYFRSGGTTVLQAAFEHSYFADPDRVRQETPLYPDRARFSREHYPNLKKGDRATWEGRDVKLDDNSAAQRAWVRYSRRPIERAPGYGVRHVWGHPWNPDAFTAGWNLCYMPFWAGMLTERQHPHPELEKAVRQAAWDLYFRHDPVCAPPNFVTNPGIDLNAILDGQPLLILAGGRAPRRRAGHGAGASGDDIDGRIREIRRATRQSWSNLSKAVLSLQGEPHEPFGTPNVQATARSVLRRIQRETGQDLTELERRLRALGP